MKILFINKQEIDSVFCMKDAIVVAKASLASYTAGNCDIPLRSTVSIDAIGSTLYMPGYDRESKSSAVKIVSVYPENHKKGLPNVPGTIILLDTDTGIIKAILDGTHITRIRTGAAGGAGIDLLARKNAKIFALFGTGGQAATQLEACLCVRDIELVKVFDIDPKRAAVFAEEMSAKFGVSVVAAKDANDAIFDADIITAVTTAKKPVFDGRGLKAGCHVNSIGSYTPDMQEIGEEVVLRADKIFCDTREGVLSESGCIIRPIQAGLLTESDISGELGEILLGRVKGREFEHELTYLDCVGTAALDVIAAGTVYEKAAKAGLGMEIEFEQ